MKLTLIKDAGGHKAGETIERTDSIADILINGGVAQKAEGDEKPKPKTRAAAAKAKADDANDDEADE